MTLNWPIIMLLFILSIPGILIAIPRFMDYLLKDNSAEVKKRMSKLGVMQSAIMVFVMSIAGSILSEKTSLGSPILSPLLNGHPLKVAFFDTLLTTLVITSLSFGLFWLLHRTVFRYLISEANQKVLHAMRHKIGLDGLILYNSISEEIIARWGLLNVIVYFGYLLSRNETTSLVWISILLSAFMYALVQLPKYIAAGCKPTRSFLYGVVLLSVYQSVLFGFIFWHYGLMPSILAHMFFQCLYWVSESAASAKLGKQNDD